MVSAAAANFSSSFGIHAMVSLMGGCGDVRELLFCKISGIGRSRRQDKIEGLCRLFDDLYIPACRDFYSKFFERLNGIGEQFSSVGLIFPCPCKDFRLLLFIPLFSHNTSSLE